MNPDLPVYSLRGALQQRLGDGNRVVLVAPTGSGKSTQVPQFLVDDGISDREVLVLQPRRIAARMLARRVAAERGCRLGQEVGFQTRFERMVSDRTRIRFVTDGILPRLLLQDRTLRRFDAVVFDEFHERSLAADLGLALLRQLQERRPELKLVVMSATLDGDALCGYLDGAPLLETSGRIHPVAVQYRSAPASEPTWEQTVAALKALLAREPFGDVLIFMPGRYEIGRTVEAIRDRRFGEPLTVLPLYGDLPADRQDAVMEPSDRRKIIVATNIAETSLTIPGVRHVIDSGLARVQRYDPARSINALEVAPVSRASAEQRAGRAGREGPGSCIRLWSARQHESRADHELPEMLRVDLTALVLQLKVMGFGGVDALPWLEPPPAAPVAAAESLLTLLGAQEAGGAVTPLGRQLSELPVHPRLGRLLVEAAGRGCLERAALVAALVSERPVALGGKQNLRAFRDRFPCTSSGRGRPGRGTSRDRAAHGAATELESDLFALERAVTAARECRFAADACGRMGINGSACRQVLRTRDHLVEVCASRGLVGDGDDDPAALLQSVLLAFPDHLGKRRDAGTLICGLRNNRRGELDRDAAARPPDLLVAAEIRQVARSGQAGRVVLGMVSEVRSEWLDQLFPDHWEFVEEMVWNTYRQAVEELRVTRCLGVDVDETRTGDVDPLRAAEMLAAEIRRRELVLQGWGKDVDQWIARCRCLAEWLPERGILSYTPEELEIAMQEFCAGERRYQDVRSKPALPYVRNLMSWEDQQVVETMAPTHLPLPSGRRLMIQYEPGHPPKGRARIQDLFGVAATPSVAGGRVRLLLEIQAPNMRAVQVTEDIAGFWRDLYPQVRRQLSKRYPKHRWPPPEEVAGGE